MPGPRDTAASNGNGIPAVAGNQHRCSGLTSGMGLTGEKSKGLQTSIPFWILWGRICIHAFSSFQSCPRSSAPRSFPQWRSQRQQVETSMPSSSLASPSASFPTFKKPCDYIGPSQVIHDKLPSKIPSALQSSTFTGSQDWDTDILRGRYSAPHTVTSEPTFCRKRPQ